MSAGFLHRYLDPSETLLEVLFGLIMALTLTAGARLLSENQNIDAAGLAAGLVGCNVAWGIIDAVFYLLGARFSRCCGMQAPTGPTSCGTTSSPPF